MAGIALNRSRQAPAQDTPSFGAIAERFRRAGDLDRAIALCEEGLKKFPNQLSARVTLGWALLDKGEYDLARQELERVIRRAPDNLAAIRGLAELHDRAEHAVTGLDSNGVWTPPEELNDEAVVGADAPGAAFIVEAQASIVEQAGGQAAPLPLPPLPVTDVAAADVDPQSLIETPAQAAVAHAGGALVEPPSVVEDALDDIAQPPAELVSPAALAIDGLDGASAADPTTLLPDSFQDPVAGPAVSFDPMGPAVDLAAATESLDAWVDHVRQPESALEAEPILFAENGEIELARMASELAASPSEAGVSDAVIDLPVGDSGIEGTFFQFEAAASDPTPSEDIALLDPLSDVPVVEAFDESMLDPEFSPALDVELAAENSIDLAMAVEPTHEVATVLAFDQAVASGLDRENEWPAVADPAGDVGGEPQPLVIEAEPAAEIPESVELSEMAEFGAVPESPEINGVPATAEFASPSVELPDATLEAAAEVLLQTPADVQAFVAPEPVHDLPADAQGHSEVVVDGPAEFEPTAVAALEPTVEVAVESAVETDLEPTVEIASGRVEEAPHEAGQPAAAWPDAAAEPEADAGPALEMAPSGIFAPIAHGDDDDQDIPGPELAADDVDERSESAESQDLPGLAAAAAAHISDGDADLFPMPAMAQEPGRGAAPIAALEGFLQKISARRLHLTPGSVA